MFLDTLELTHSMVLHLQIFQSSTKLNKSPMHGFVSWGG